MRGIVFGEIKPFHVQALLTEYQEGEAILGRLVQIKNGDKLIIGRVVDFHRLSDLLKDYDQAKLFDKRKESAVAKELLSFREGIILEIDLITALSGNTRVPLNFPVKLLSEVEFLEDFPFEGIAYTGYLGHFWGTNIKAPLILQDFQTLKEAYHFFVAGQTGSGKSTLVQMLLALYNKLNPRMNFLILDTVGEFTASFKGERELFLHLKDVWQGQVEIYTPPENLALEGWDLFKELCLENEIMKHLDVPVKSVENARGGIEYIVGQLIESLKKEREQEEKKLANLFQPNRREQITTGDLTCEIVEKVVFALKGDEEFVKSIYKRDDKSRDRVKFALHNPEKLSKFVKALQEIVKLFTVAGTNKKTIREVVSGFLESAWEGSSGKCVVLDFTLYKASGNLVGMRSKYVRETLRHLYNAGIDLYRKSGNLNLNTLVVLEEAHNYVPKRIEDKETNTLSDEIVKYFIETRKFGIGWMCITTRPSNVRREVFDHSRVKFIGMGLTSGPDAELLKEAFGPEFLNTYRLFPDPSDPLSHKKEVCFAISGPITILSRQSPDFITVFSSKEEFLKVNWE
ncbi:MAG: helicase HerA domain-containing protein [Thermocrinis sp.]|jgi:energy-coupling factor transporter ATP-binding protein EcfA2|uniref:ATP-binding protein n=1 Tax=Thermocrinis sp. TaxID=2024383 RepID=UPI003C09374A